MPTVSGSSGGALTEAERDEILRGLSNQKQQILDDAADDGLTPADEAKLKEIEAEINRISGPDPDDGPASDDEALTGEELDAADQAEVLEQTLTGEELDAGEAAGFRAHDEVGASGADGTSGGAQPGGGTGGGGEPDGGSSGGGSGGSGGGPDGGSSGGSSGGGSGGEPDGGGSGVEGGGSESAEGTDDNPLTGTVAPPAGGGQLSGLDAAPGQVGAVLPGAGIPGGLQPAVPASDPGVTDPTPGE